MTDRTDFGRATPLAIALVVVLAGGLAFWFTRGADTPELPAIDLAGAAPGVEAAVSSAQEALRRNPDDAESWGRVGAVLDINGLQTEAVPYYRGAIERSSDWRWPYFLGICLRTTDLAAAAEQFILAERSNGSHLGLLVASGRALDQLDRIDEARRRFDRALEIDKQCAPALEGLAGIALRADELSEAERLLGLATGAAPRYAPAWRLLAQVQERRGNMPGATVSRRRADRGSDALPLSDPERTALVRDEGVLETHRLSRERGYVAAGRIKEAIRDWNRHLDVDPDSALAHQRLCGLHVALGDDAAAREHLRRAIDLEPDRPDAHIAYGVALARRQRNAEAEKALRTALTKQGDLHGARVHLGSLLCATGHLEEGIPLLETAVADDPHDPDALYNLGAAQFAAGVPTQAVQTFESLAEVVPKHQRVYDLWGHALQKIGKEAEAYTVLRRGYDASPDNLLTINRLAWVFATARDAAVRDGKRALSAARQLTNPRRAPPSALFFDTLAAAWAENGKFEEAVAAAEKAIEMAEAPPSGPPDPDLAKRIRTRLETCYKAKRPWRGPP